MDGSYLLYKGDNPNGSKTSPQQPIGRRSLTLNRSTTGIG